MTALSGEKHIGEFQNDTFHGEGVHTWPSGAEYKGQYKGGKRHGSG